MDTKTPVRSRTSEMKLGKITYLVTTMFDEAANETAEQKLLRLVVDRVSAEMKSPTLAARV